MTLRSFLDRGPAALRPPTRDPSPDSLAAGVAQPLRGELEALLGTDRVLTRPGDLIKYASDASPYSPRASRRSATRSAPTPSSAPASAASSRSRTRPGTASARTSTPRRRWRSSAS